MFSSPARPAGSGPPPSTSCSPPATRSLGLVRSEAAATALEAKGATALRGDLDDLDRPAQGHRRRRRRHPPGQQARLVGPGRVQPGRAHRGRDHRRTSSSAPTGRSSSPPASPASSRGARRPSSTPRRTAGRTPRAAGPRTSPWSTSRRACGRSASASPRPSTATATTASSTTSSPGPARPARPATSATARPGGRPCTAPTPPAWSASGWSRPRPARSCTRSPSPACRAGRSPRPSAAGSACPPRPMTPEEATERLGFLGTFFAMDLVGLQHDHPGAARLDPDRPDPARGPRERFVLPRLTARCSPRPVGCRADPTRIRAATYRSRRGSRTG